MNEKWKKWINAKCTELDRYLQEAYPLTDENWNSVAGFIDVTATLGGEYKNEVRRALFEITTKWEKKQYG